MDKLTRWTTSVYEVDFINKRLIKHVEINNFHEYKQVMYESEKVADESTPIQEYTADDIPF